MTNTNVSVVIAVKGNIVKVVKGKVALCYR